MELVEDLFYYVFKARNPILVIFYWVATCSGSLVAALSAHPYMSASQEVLGLILLALCLATYAQAADSDPGIVSIRNVDQLHRCCKPEMVFCVLILEGRNDVLWCCTRLENPLRACFC